MTRFDLYTALIGICGVLFSLTIFIGVLPPFVKIPLIIFGVVVFIHSAYTLYRSLTDDKFLEVESALRNSTSKTAILFFHGNFMAERPQLSEKTLAKILLTLTWEKIPTRQWLMSNTPF